MHTLTITVAGPAPSIVTEHRDRATAVAALETYISATDREPIANQVTVDYESYDLICLAQQRVAATASIEPTPGAPATDLGTVSEAELDRLDAGAPVCLEVRPGTLGFQLCWREDHHRGDHKSQDGPTWSSQ
ncbi:hypothetical protein [Mycobacterium avium]|uniref:hypothetical protein n=1 Tax=Mycobacterium avium TaxID=1764 RepID=UPI000B4AF4A2|nr:hypothetical protein [Mycobacterium avium]